MPATLLDRLARRASRHTSPCGDGQLVWRTWGASDRPPLVLLHGGSGHWGHWVRNIEALLAAGWRVIVPDLPGFGDSTAPPDGEDADVLPGWLEPGLQALVGDRPVPLVGFSFGGLVAGLWAAARPARVARLVLVGAPALSAERLAPLDLRNWRSAPPGPAREALHRHNLGQLMLHRADAGDAAGAADAQALALAVHAQGVERDRLRRRRLMLTDALARLLPDLRCPVHGIWGEHDVLYAMRRPLVAEVLSRAPGFRGLAWIAGAGHWVMFEDAPAFDAALLGALAAPYG